MTTTIVTLFVLLLIFLLYAFYNINRENKKRTLAIMLHVNVCLASLEKRLAEDRLRSPEEIDAAIERYLTQLQEQQGKSFGAVDGQPDEGDNAGGWLLILLLTSARPIFFYGLCGILGALVGFLGLILIGWLFGRPNPSSLLGGTSELQLWLPIITAVLAVFEAFKFRAPIREIMRSRRREQPKGFGE